MIETLPGSRKELPSFFSRFKKLKITEAKKKTTSCLYHKKNIPSSISGCLKNLKVSDNSTSTHPSTKNIFGTLVAVLMDNEARRQLLLPTLDLF